MRLFHTQTTAAQERCLAHSSNCCSWWGTGLARPFLCFWQLPLLPATVGKEGGERATVWHTGRGAGSALLLSCPQVWLTCPAVPGAARVSSIVLLRRGARPILPCATAGERQWQLHGKGQRRKCIFPHPCHHMAVGLSTALTPSSLAPSVPHLPTKRVSSTLQVLTWVRRSANCLSLVTPGPAFPAAAGSEGKGRREVFSHLPILPYGK